MASDTEYYRRTAITRLDELSQQDRELLNTTVEEWLDRCNIAASLAWENEHTQAGVRSIVKATVQQKTDLMVSIWFDSITKLPVASNPASNADKTADK